MKIKGMLFILFAACVGHIGAMEPDKDKEPGPKRQRTSEISQTFQPLTLSQQALIQTAKQLAQDVHSKKDIKSLLSTIPTDLHVPLLAEIGRQYYILYGEKINTGQEWGVSIQDYLNSPVLQNKIQITTFRGKTELTLVNMKINNLSGLQNIPNIGTVQILRLNHNQLRTIQTNAFAGLTNLTYLSLYNNQLTIILTKAFAGLTNLQSLFLNHNQLTIISTNAFAGLTNLTYLTLSNNQLRTIQTNAFAGLTNLTKLFLNNNQLTIIQPNAFAGLPNLRNLTLSNNQLDKKTKEAIRKALQQRVKISFFE